MLPWKQEVHRSEMHVLILTNIYEVCNSHNRQTVTMNKRKCNTTISLPISIKHIIRGPYGDLILVILGARRGQKLRLFLKKKVKAFLQIKINCTKFVLKCHIYIIQLELKNINGLKSH